MAAADEQLGRDGEILFYALEGWMVREYPGGRIERLCPAEQFRAADFHCPR